MGHTVKEYSQMIGFLTRDKTSTVPRPMVQETLTMDQEPVTMDQGGRIRFEEGLGVEQLSKKEKIAQGLEKGRVSTKIDVYTDAVNDFDKMVKEAFDLNDANKLPESFQRFLMKRGLNDSTYYSLKAFDVLPNVKTDAANLRLDLANKLIDESNNQLKFIEKETLLKNSGFTSNEVKALSSMKGNTNKIDKAGDKARKAYDFLFKNQDAVSTDVRELFNPRNKISELTGLDGGTISKKFSVQAYDPEGFDFYKKLSNNKIQKAVNESDIPFDLTEFKNYSFGSQTKSAATRKGRLDKATKLAGEGVADINTAQKDVVKLLNDHYKKNPDELLGNTKLRNLLDLTLEDGEIVKKNKYVTDDDFRKLIQDKKGLFTMDHVDEVQFEKLSTEFPIFKQLATYNTNSGLIKSMKSYMSKNQNNKDPAVQNKIKKQVEFLEDLKLRVDTPTGRVGSKEVLAAVDRKAGVLPNFLAQLRALNITLPKKAKVALGAIGGLSATTLATAEEVSQTPFPGMKPQGSPGQLNPETEEGFTTGQKVAGTGVAAGGAYAARKPIMAGLGKAFRTLGTRPAGVGMAGYSIADNLKKGENVVDATLDPIVGLELMLPNLFKENIGKITSNPYIQKALKFGKYGRALTPIGAGITAAGLGIDAYKYGKERKKLLDSLTDEQKTDLFRQEQSDVVKQQLRGDQNTFDEFSAAEGGLANLMKKYYD